MQWYKITISTTIYGEDMVCSLLYDMGISQTEIINDVPLTEEEKSEMFIDILPGLDQDKEDSQVEESSQVVFYMEMTQDILQVISEIEEGLNNLREFVDIGSGKIEKSITKDEDWANNWKEYFKAFRVAEDIIIKPSWEDISDNDKVNENDIIIEIDPEMAFGTGTHETTRLAIEGLRNNLKKGQNILDLGCGSGILSIIAKKLGANKVTATDVDQKAVKTAIENSKDNKLASDDILFLLGNVLSQEDSEELDQKIGLGTYDIVIANILANVIIGLADIVGKYLKPGGYFISTGILNTQTDDVKEALKRNKFDIIEVKAKGDWVSIRARKQ